MAKLTRITRKETVQPTGIVPATALREGARSMMELSKTAQDFQGFFTSYAAGKLKEKAQEDASLMPSEKQRRALMDDKNEYIADSDGNPIQAEFYTPIQEKKVGPFGSAYAETWNKEISQRNLNAARETARRQLATFESSYAENLDYKGFEVASEAYLRKTVEDMPAPLRGALEEELRTYQNSIYINLQTQNRDRTTRQNDALQQTLLADGVSRLTDKVSRFGPADPGALKEAARVVDIHAQRRSTNKINDQQFDYEVNKIADIFANGAVINQVQSRFRGDNIEASLAAASGTAAQIISGDLMVQVAEYDRETGAFNPVTKSIADIIPDVNQRTTLANQAYDIAYSKYNAIKNGNNLEVTTFTNELQLYENMANQAALTGNEELLAEARSKVNSVLERANSTDPQIRAGLVKESLASIANIQGKQTLLQEEYRLLESLRKAETLIGEEFVTGVEGFYLDDFKSREEYIASGTLQDRVAALKSQAKVLEDAYNAATKPLPGQVEFFEYMQSGTSTTEPSKEMRNFSDTLIEKMFPDNNWATQDFAVSTTRASIAYERGVVPPSLVTEFRTAINQAVDDPERLQRAMKIFQGTDNYQNSLTDDNLKRQMGDEAYRTYKYIRNQVDVAGQWPTESRFVDNIQKVFSGENVMSYNDLDPEARKGISEAVDSELDRSFFMGQLFLSEGDISYFEDLPQLPPRMRDQLRTIALDEYQQVGGDAKSAGKDAAKIAYDRVTSRQWSYDDVAMAGSYKEWVEYPVQKQYDSISLPGIKSIVREKLTSSRADADQFHFLERGYGVGAPQPGEIKTEVKLRVSRLDNNNQPIYKLVSRNADLDPEMPDSSIYIDMYDDNGNLIEVDFRNTDLQLKRVRSNIIAVDREIERLNTKSKIQAFGGAEEVQQRAEDISALKYIRNAMTYYPENVIGLYDKGIDLQPIDIKYHGTAPLGQNEQLASQATRQEWFKTTGCPIGFVNNGTGCVLERRPSVRLEDLEDLDPNTFAPREGASVVADPQLTVEVPNG